MNRNRLLGLFLFIALIVPQPSQAQIGGYYHMVGVYIDYTYVVREMTDAEDPGNGYAVTASWPSAASPLYTHELLSFNVGDTIAVVPVPLVNPALLGAYGVDLYLNLSDDGDMFITGTYPTISVEDCSTAITIPPVEDPATYRLGGDPILDETAGTATWGFGIVTSGIFANQMHAPDLNTEEEGVDFGIGTEQTCWGMITAQYNDDFTRIESAEVYWEAQDGVETTLGVDTEGNLNRTFGVTGAFGDHTTIPYMASLNPAINVGTYPMIGGSGADVNGDGSIDGADGFIPNPELEWGYLFDPVGADGVAFNGDEPTQFTGYYFTGNLLTALGAVNAAVGPDADGDGVPDNIAAAIAQYMAAGYDQATATVMAVNAVGTAFFSGLAQLWGVDSTTAVTYAAGVGSYADSLFQALSALGLPTDQVLTAVGQSTGVYALGVLTQLGVQVNDSDHDYGATINALANAGCENEAASWETYPNANSQANVTTGETLYNSSDTFVAYEGTSARKLWGMYTGGENMENNFFQTWSGVYQGGETFNVSAMFYTHNADDLSQGNGYGVLFAKYFDSNWGMISMDSVHFRGATPDEWHEVSLAATVPASPAVVQVGVMHVQPTNDDHGSFYVDNFYMGDGMPSSNGRLVMQVGNNCIPDFSTQRVNPVFANAGGVGVESEESMIPEKFALYDNFPNPFNPTTQITIDLPEDAYTELTVWNIMGQQVATVYSGSLNAGRHNVTFNGRDMNGSMLSSGMYIYRVTAGKYNATKKMTLMK